MNRIFSLFAALTLSLVLLSSCASAPAASSASAEDTTASASSVTESSASSGTAATPVASSDVASSDSASRASSDRASSDRASSDRASSDRASSDRASSNAASSEPVLSGPSGLAEMNVSMNYVSGAEVLSMLNSNSKDKVFIDLRKPADYKEGHIAGSISAPVNKAVDNNDYADAIAELTSALHDAVGNEVGEGKDLILICYQGKKYAQAATDILNALGGDMDHVYTLEGGMKAWTEANNPTTTS